MTDHRAVEMTISTVQTIARLNTPLAKIGIDLIADEVQVVHSGTFQAANDAHPFESGLLSFTPLQPVLIAFEQDSTGTTSHTLGEHPHVPAVRAYLTDHLDPETDVTWFRGDTFGQMPVGELANVDQPDFVFIPAQDEFTVGGQRDPRAMHRIVARLRRPDGCHWDRKQTHATLAKNLVDEVYEVVDAIEANDPAGIAEELGDIYLLLLMQAQIASEAGTFSIEDVYAGIARKIIGRHPHVFGEAVVQTDADLAQVWAVAKQQEQVEGTKRGGNDLDGEPFSMPGLTRATRVLKAHPIHLDDSTPALLRAVAEIVANGGDPDTILKQQLRDHVASQPFND